MASKVPMFSGKIAPEHRVVYQFSCSGTDYFKYDDTMQVPCGRAYHALAFYDEFDNRCTREFLQANEQSRKNLQSDIIEILRSNTVNIIDIYKKVEELEKLSQIITDRLDYVFVPEIVEKLASVIYFDESENPYGFEFKYAHEKIKTWRENPITIKGKPKQSVDTDWMPIDFFLSEPIKSLLPHINLSKQDLHQYLETMNMTTKDQARVILSNLSGKDQSKDFFKAMQLLSETT